MSQELPTPPWPPRHNIIGVRVSATSYEDLLDIVMRAAAERRSSCITHLAVHGVVEGSRDPGFGAMLEQFDVIAPDGHPVRHALNALYKTQLADRCYGPEFTLRVCAKATAEGVGVYLYGSRQQVVEAMRNKLIGQFPGLRIVGCEPSVFRPLSDEEDAALVERINGSGAGVLFVGLGCPLQEKFACAHKGRIHAVMICVGAAFDFHAGAKKMAPAWMQRHSLEWLYRLCQEPRRLWRRYLVYNTIYVVRVLLQALRLKSFALPGQSSCRN